MRAYPQSSGPDVLVGEPGSLSHRLTIFIRETDLYRHGPLYAEIIHRARKTGLTGATAFHGVSGFSAPDCAQSRRWSLSDYVPLVIVIVDTKERIEAFLPLLEEVMDSGIAVLEQVWVRP
jgi:PII-like signaling protein